MTSVFVDDAESYDRGGIQAFQRRVFCRDYMHYKPGQHIVFGGPSTRGKTTLAFDLLEFIVTPNFPAYLAQSKPRDPVTEQRGAQLHFRTVQDWPPERKIQEIFGEKPPGYIVCPRFGNLDTDMIVCAEVTRKLLMDRYAAGTNRKNKGGVLVMDDTMIKAKILGLDSEMVTILAMAGAMDLGLWIFVQRPSDSGRTPLWGYEQATHLFFTKGGDNKMLERYAEIIGDQGRYAKQIIPTLETFEFLYVHKTEGWMCIVRAD